MTVALSPTNSTSAGTSCESCRAQGHDKSDTVCYPAIKREVQAKVKQYHYIPGQALRVQEFEAPRFQDNRNMKAVKLSVLRTVRLYLAGNIPGTHFC